MPYEGSCDILDCLSGNLFGILQSSCVNVHFLGGLAVKSGYINKDLEETRRLLDQVRKGGKRAEKAREKLEAKGIKYYTAEEAQDLGMA